MSLRINDTIPNLDVETDEGKTSLHDFVGESWTILFSHPKDFTPVCTTEFGAAVMLFSFPSALRSARFAVAVARLALVASPIARATFRFVLPHRVVAVASSASSTPTPKDVDECGVDIRHSPTHRRAPPPCLARRVEARRQTPMHHPPPSPCARQPRNARSAARTAARRMTMSSAAARSPCARQKPRAVRRRERRRFRRQS